MQFSYTVSGTSSVAQHAVYTIPFKGADCLVSIAIIGTGIVSANVSGPQISTTHPTAGVNVSLNGTNPEQYSSVGRFVADSGSVTVEIDVNPVISANCTILVNVTSL